MVINLSKNFVQNQSFFIVGNEIQMLFLIGKTGSRERKSLNFKRSSKNKLVPRIKKLYQITYIFCNTVSSVSIQPFYTN